MEQQKDAGIRDGFARTKNHGRIHYREAGSGEPLILMHTNGGSAYQHDPVDPLRALWKQLLLEGDPSRAQRGAAAQRVDPGLRLFADLLAQVVAIAGLGRRHRVPLDVPRPAVLFRHVANCCVGAACPRGANGHEYPQPVNTDEASSVSRNHPADLA